jgi:hypothetical protein
MIRNSAEPLTTISVRGKQWHDFINEIKEGAFDQI